MCLSARVVLPASYLHTKTLQNTFQSFFYTGCTGIGLDLSMFEYWIQENHFFGIYPIKMKDNEAI